MYNSVEDFLAKIESEGLDYAISVYCLKSRRCPPGKVKDAYKVIEDIMESDEYRKARQIIEQAVVDEFGY